MKEGELLQEWDDHFYMTIPAAVPTLTHRAMTMLVTETVPAELRSFTLTSTSAIPHCGICVPGQGCRGQGGPPSGDAHLGSPTLHGLWSSL